MAAGPVADAQNIDPNNVYFCPDGSYTNMLSVVLENKCKKVPNVKIDLPTAPATQAARPPTPETSSAVKSNGEESKPPTRWLAFGKTDAIATYILDSAPQAYGDTTRQWFLYDHTYHQQSIIALQQFDCKLKRMATIQSSTYERPMGAGKVIYEKTTPSDESPQYDYVVPGSIGDLELQAECSEIRGSRRQPPSKVELQNRDSSDINISGTIEERTDNFGHFLLIRLDHSIRRCGLRTTKYLLFGKAKTITNSLIEDYLGRRVELRGHLACPIGEFIPKSIKPD